VYFLESRLGSHCPADFSSYPNITHEPVDNRNFPAGILELVGAAISRTMVLQERSLGDKTEIHIMIFLLVLFCLVSSTNI